MEHFRKILLATGFVLLAGLAQAQVSSDGISQDKADDGSQPRVEDAGENPIFSGGAFMAMDGDTLRFFPPDPKAEFVHIRLFGVDAPEAKDTPYGQRATMALSEIVLRAGSDMVCEQVDVDRYKRPVAVCYNPHREINSFFRSKRYYPTINAAIVGTGHATIYNHYFWPREQPTKAEADRWEQLTKGMLKAQRDAVRNQRGIWAGFTMR